MTSLIILFCSSLLFIGLASASPTKDLTDAVTVIGKAKDILESIDKIAVKINPAAVFSQISKVLVFLGPAMMAVSAVMSVVAIFLPKSDSAELKAINAGFDKVNRRLDVITSEIKDLKTIVELSSAKSAYIKCVTAIETNYQYLLYAKEKNEKSYYDYFVKQYEISYDLAASNLYDAMTGKLGPFGFNLVNLYKDHVKCNPLLVSKFCTMGMQILTKGLAVEGAYLGSQNLSDSAKVHKDTWEKKMQLLADSCVSVIKNCQDNWKMTAAQHFRETYNKEISFTGQDFAEKVALSMNDVVPQRSWLVVSYNDASGFEEHTFGSTYENDKIWNENGRDVTIFSTEYAEQMKDSEYNVLKEKINAKRNKSATMTDCQMAQWKPDKKEHYSTSDLRPLVSFLQEIVRNGLVYLIRNDKSPIFKATGSTVYSMELQWKCTSKNYRLIIFI